MGWKRQNICLPERPRAPSMWRWGTAGVLLSITGILLFTLHVSASFPFLSNINIWIISLFPVVLWLLLVCIRGALFSHEFEKYEFLQRESAFAQSQWQQWGGRNFSILNSCVLLPGKVTASLLINEAGNFENQFGLITRIDYLAKLNSSTQAILILLKTMAECIIALPDDIHLHVTLITDGSPDASQQLEKSFKNMWYTSFPSCSPPISVKVENNLPLYHLDSILNSNEPRCELFFVIQLNGGSRYSDGLAAFLLTNDDTAHHYSLMETCRLLRPMPLDMSNLKEDLTTYFTTQTDATKTQVVIADCQKVDLLNSQLYPIGHRYGARWQVENSVILEKFIGIPGPFSGWLSAGLAADMAQSTSESYLTVSVQDVQSYICTVLPGSKE